MSKRSKKKKLNSSGRAEYQAPHHEVLDTEVQCAKCGAQLYVSPEDATRVFASLRNAGAVGLVCLCGHIQFINTALRPIATRTKKRQHD